MAKTGDEPPGTAGSQFFVVTGAGRRPAARVRGARQGHRRGSTWSDRQLGDPGAPDEKPTEPVVIEGMRVRSS